MSEFIGILQREFIYIFYYAEVQFRQIFVYWIFGMAIGSFISVFAKNRIHETFVRLKDSSSRLFGIILACILGIASPLCMYGTIPIAASFHKQGMRQDWLATFMMASILLNPQLIIYSAALGMKVLAVRIISCFVCGCSAGLLIHLFFKDKEFFDFKGFDAPKNKDTHPNLFIRYLQNFYRNIRTTGFWFLTGILLSAVFQRYVPEEAMVTLFGNDQAWGVLMAATIGVPLYACGGGTIPILAEWLREGMSIGSAAAFMITGPATKITNLGALKIVTGWKHFLIYIAFIMLFSLFSGLLINLLI
ncbi:MAG: permease [Erysipelotrichaceae bacterium]|nr:permease [Erysipelotrichaceae bacterium]